MRHLFYISNIINLFDYQNTSSDYGVKVFRDKATGHPMLGGGLY